MEFVELNLLLIIEDYPKMLALTTSFGVLIKKEKIDSETTLVTLGVSCPVGIMAANQVEIEVHPLAMAVTFHMV